MSPAAWQTPSPRTCRILVVDDGRIVESGSHADLIARKNGRYRNLQAAQATGDPVHRLQVKG